MEEKIQRLSEGMDFLEEACGTSSEPLIFSETDKIEISEGVSNPSPFKILGVAKGCFAPINEFSRNRRLYSPELWPTVLQNEELKSRLSSRAVFGCLGHADKLVDDRDIQEGKVSHIVTLLEVRNDKNTGKPYLYGELEILDTPAGRILEAMYKGGANLYVSSRAAGKLVPVPGQNYSLVKPDQYHVHTFDIVCRPGFLQAHPMFEAISTNESVNEENINELNNSTVESDLKKREDQMYDSEAHAKENPKAAAEAKKKFENAVNLAQKRADRNDEILDQDKNGNPVHYKNESEEIATLRSQIDQLAKILEKIVDDVYEEEGIVEAKDAEGNEHEIIKSENKDSEHPYRLEHKVNGKTVSVSANDFPADVKKEEEHIKKSYGIKEDKKELRKAAIPAFLKIVAESNISEEALSEIIDMIKGDLK